MLQYVQSKLGQVIQQRVNWLEVRFKRWTQPTKTSQVVSTLTDLTRSKSDLIAENMFLRQQLIVLERQVTRLRLQHSVRFDNTQGIFPLTDMISQEHQYPSIVRR